MPADASAPASASARPTTARPSVQRRSVQRRSVQRRSVQRNAPSRGRSRRWAKIVTMTSLRTPDPNPGWLSDFALEEPRSRGPILYVEAVPARVDAIGQIEQVGVLLRGSAATGQITRTLVWG